MIQAIEASSPRRVASASASPTCLAWFCCSAGSRPARIAINTRLSTPSTISRAVSVRRLAQSPGSVSQSIPIPPFAAPLQITGRSLRAFRARLGSSELPAGLGGGAGEFRAQFRLGNGDAFLFEVGLHLFDDIGIARCLEVSRDDRLGIDLCLLGRHAQPRCRPQTEQSVAARGDPEHHFLVALELGFERLLAFREALHKLLVSVYRLAWAASIRGVGRRAAAASQTG